MPRRVSRRRTQVFLRFSQTPLYRTPGRSRFPEPACSILDRLDIQCCCSASESWPARVLVHSIRAFVYAGTQVLAATTHRSGFTGLEVERRYPCNP